MKQILTLQELVTAAKDRKSVIVNHFIPSPSPAAWVVNIIGARLATYLDAGMFIYVKPKGSLSKFSDKRPNQIEETKLLENKT